MTNILNPKAKLNLLAAHQEEFEAFLLKLTGLTVSVSLTVHSADNSKADLQQLFGAGLSLPNFEQVSSFNRTWIAHTGNTRKISIFMPEGFDTKEYPELEDDEGYNSAIEYANAKRAEGQLKRNDDEIPF